MVDGLTPTRIGYKMKKLTKNWDYEIEWRPLEYLHVSHSWFVGTIMLVYALIAPESFGHWIGHIVRCVKEVL